MRNRLVLFSGAILASLALSAQASADAGGVVQATIGISGFVPVICRTSVSAELVTPASGTVSLGTMQEFCNNASGYQVVASYSPELASASLVVDGQAIALEQGGSTVILQSDRAAIASQQLSLQVPAGVSGGSLSFSIRPL